MMRLKLSQLVKIILILLTVQNVLFYYIEQGTIPRVFLYVFYFLSFSLSFVLIIKTKVNFTFYRTLFLSSFVLMFIISFIYLDDDFGSVVSMFVIYSQLISAFLFKRFDLDYLSNVFRIIAIIAICSLPYIFLTENIDINLALRRGYTWTEIFTYAALFWAFIPFTIISFLKGKNLTLSIVYWMGAIVLNLLFLKRFILVDSFLLLVVIFFLNTFRKEKFFNSLRFALTLGILLTALLYFKGDTVLPLFDATFKRIESSSEDISGFDRFIESENYLKDVSAFQLVFGTGFASTHQGLGKEAYALHIGWANFIFKGGLIFFLLVLIPYFKLTRLLKNFNKLPLKVQFSVCFLVIYFFRLFYINMSVMAPEMLIFFYSVFNVMDYRDTSKKSK